MFDNFKKTSTRRNALLDSSNSHGRTTTINDEKRQSFSEVVRSNHRRSFKISFRLSKKMGTKKAPLTIYDIKQ